MLRNILASEINWWLFAVFTVFILIAMVQLGYLVGRWQKERSDPEQKTQSGTILAAILALLGFLLAISFSIAENRFAQRKALVLREANAVGTTFLREISAGFFEPSPFSKPRACPRKS